ncbi:MAG: autotransporter domain-containing protein [Planctomycetia bacterium]|nr:autotransporter domain-containing protein [Planctomycetia bacterium]
MTFEGGGAGGLGATSLQLNANTNVTLDSGTSGGTIAFDQLIGEGAIEATGNDDITLSVQGGGSIDDPETGLFTGAITDVTTAGNAGKLSLTVTQGTFNYGGVASYTGNTTVSSGGTFRIDGDGLTTGLVENTDSLLMTGGTLLLETSARLLGEGEVGLASGSTIDITADATNGANLQFDNAGSIDGVITLSGDRLATYNLIFGNSTVDDSTIRGSLTASGNSGASFAGDLTVAGDGQMLLEETAIAQVDGKMSVGGLVDLSGTSADGLIVGDGLDMTDGGQIQLAGSRTLSVTGDSTMAANSGLLLDEDSAATFTGDLDNAGTISLNNATTLDVTGAVTGDGILTVSGTASATVGADAAFSILQAQDESAVSVTGNLDLTRDSFFEAGTTLSVGDILTIGDGTDPMTLIFSGNGVDQTTVTATNGINLQAGSTLVANADIDTSAINYAGDVLVGVVGENRGVLNLSSGDLDSDSTDARLQINLTGDYVNDLAGGTYGQSSVINVAGGMSDFSDGGNVFVDVQDAAYIPDDKDILLLNSPGGITGDTTVTTNQDESITRTWNINQDNGGGFDPLTQLWARSSADYATPLEGTPEYLRGVELNSLRAAANLDPTSDSGILLGALDTLDTLEAYENAIDGVGPTTQVSTIQLAANTQYFTVLRKEIQRRYDIVEQRTPAPFRLSSGTEYTSSDDQAVQSSIRRMTPESATAEGFGVFWGRNLSTPTEGEDIKGISGNEYGGMGGFAWQFGNGFLGGINLGYSQITGDLDGGFGNTRVSTVRGGGFLAWSSGEGLFFDAAIAGGWNNYKFTRIIPGTSISADSDASGFQMDLTMGGGYRFELSEGWAITPEASFMYSYINTGDINEDTSSSAALNISPGDLSSVIGRVGGGLSWSALPGLVLDGELGWQGNFNFNGNYGVSLANQGTSLSYSIDDQAVNTAYYGGGVVWTPTYNVNVSIQYEGRSGEGFSSNMIFGGVSIGF